MTTTSTGGSGVGGMSGFVPPPGAKRDIVELYEAKVRNMPWRRMYSRYGYDGGHTDSTSVEFIRRVVTPLLMKKPDSRRIAPPSPGPATRPAEEEPVDTPVELPQPTPASAPVPAVADESEPPVP